MRNEHDGAIVKKRAVEAIVDDMRDHVAARQSSVREVCCVLASQGRAPVQGGEDIIKQDDTA